MEKSKPLKDSTLQNVVELIAKKILADKLTQAKGDALLTKLDADPTESKGQSALEWLRQL